MTFWIAEISIKLSLIGGKIPIDQTEYAKFICFKKIHKFKEISRNIGRKGNQWSRKSLKII